MDKNISVSINGVVFQIEEHAYRRLSEYLESIRNYFASNDDRDEIVSDIEERVNENLSSKVNKHKPAVTLTDVEALIAAMGTVADFAEVGEEPKTEYKTGTKRLFRDPENSIISGVCGGIGAYLDIDPTFVRIVFVLSLFAGGLGVIIYLVLWVSMPLADSAADILEMRGQRVTIAKIEETLKGQVDRAKKKAESAVKSSKPYRDNVASFLRELVRLISNFFYKVLPILFSAIGLIVVIGTSAAILGVTIAGAIVASNVISGYIVLPDVWYAIGQSNLYLLVGSAWVTVVLPLAIIWLLGLSVLMRRLLINLPAVAVSIVIWGAAITTLIVTTAGILPPLIQEFGQMNPEDLRPEWIEQLEAPVEVEIVTPSTS